MSMNGTSAPAAPPRRIASSEFRSKSSQAAPGIALAVELGAADMGLFRRVSIVGVFAAIASVAAGCARQPITPASAQRAGGTIIASVRAEPKSFNRYAARDLTSEVI